MINPPPYAPLWSPDWLDRAINALVEPGFGIFPNAISPDFCRVLHHTLDQLEQQNALQRAGTGHGQSLEVRSELRSDSIHWLSPEEENPALQHWWDAANEFRQIIKRSLFLPLSKYEGHLARYPAEGFYKAHLDQHRGKPFREITLILYLNEDWQETNGGQLRLYTDPQLGTQGPYLDFLPKLGTIALFRSANFWHEVLPSTRSRSSLTGWFRTE